MTTETSRYTYYSSRSKAQAAAKATAGLKFSDRGANKTKGMRWATYEAAAKSAPAPKVNTKATASGSSKKAAAVKLITKMLAKDKSRQDVLAALVAKCDLSAPGASTYYANVKNGTWS